MNDETRNASKPMRQMPDPAAGWPGLRLGEPPEQTGVDLLQSARSGASPSRLPRPPAAVLILTQVIMGVLAGAWGVIVATPLLAVAMVLIQQLYVREFIKKKIHVIGSPEEENPDSPTEASPT